MSDRPDLSPADFDFPLPPELIAQHPAPERSASRLLDGRGPVPQDRGFRDLPSLLQPGDLLVFNDTRVVKARLHGRKPSGGAVEALVERVLHAASGVQGHEVLAHLRASKSPRAGSTVEFLGRDGEPAFVAEVLGRGGPDGSLFHLRLPADPLALMDAHGHVPLPPYITHADDADDERRYQTVFAARPGAVAAPTAALHFDDALLAAWRARRAARPRHAARGRRHLPAGARPKTWPTTDAQRVVRGGPGLRRRGAALPRARRPRGGRGHHQRAHAGVGRAAQRHPRARAATPDIFITPGFRFKVVDVLVTNFHLPRSTLMMLVSAFAGHERVMALYRHAVEARYRFFSYGDAMLLDRRIRRSRAGRWASRRRWSTTATGRSTLRPCSASRLPRRTSGACRTAPTSVPTPTAGVRP
jgi:S-adenosylmethionine:tRNA ribosyltransferase-isomerase